jgi:protein-L-isoaspartate(D-aspartate) O-methyltransferase
MVIANVDACTLVKRRQPVIARHLPGLKTAAASSVVVTIGVVNMLAFGIFPGTESEPTQAARREQMVKTQLEARGIKDKAVLAAMRKVPRHRFVPALSQGRAYDDGPLPIGEAQTISQPYIVAWMTELIEPKKAMRVLEIGTGSGYQAAVLAECVAEIDTIEVIPELGRKAEGLLRELGYRNVRTRIGDGYAGWPERAPYDAILLTAAPPDDVPKPLLDQLKVGGRLVAPVGRDDQHLVRITRTETGLKREVLDSVRFVPMTGKVQGRPSTNQQE